MKYSDEEIEKAARILCEMTRTDFEFLSKHMPRGEALSTYDFYRDKALVAIRDRANIEEALRRAKGESCADSP